MPTCTSTPRRPPLPNWRPRRFHEIAASTPPCTASAALWTPTTPAPTGLRRGSGSSVWNDYLAHFNKGRGVVLIGHSEGSYQLAQILISHIDQVPSVRKLLVSAVITGQDLPVYTSGFGPLKTIGPCRSDTQTGCVIDYNAYSGTPPSDAKFGRVPALLNGHRVQDICTNPADLGGGSGELISMYRTHLPTQQVAGSMVQGIFGAHAPTSSTPWVEYDGLYSARCVTRNGARVLRVTAQHGAPSLSPLPDARRGVCTSTTRIWPWGTWWRWSTRRQRRTAARITLPPHRDG